MRSYGISVTTLEEVFLKVASGDVVPRSTERPPKDFKENLNDKNIFK